MSVVLYILGGLIFIGTIKLFGQGSIGAGIFGLLLAAGCVALGIYLKKRKDKKKAIEDAAKSAAAKQQRVANLQKQAGKELKQYDEMFDKEDKPDDEEE